ncbi:MAG TPA: molybdopterin dinucleotide binding domain-containing protein, partial [Polyangiaceae bacterium]
VDARQLGIAPDDSVAVTSPRGSVLARAFVTNNVQPGHVFMPMHYETMNQLTFSAFDPYSRQPAYKACAVRLSKASELPA